MNKGKLIRDLIAEIKRLKQERADLTDQLAKVNESEYGDGYDSYYATENYYTNQRLQQAESARREAERQAENARYEHEQYTDLMEKASRAYQRGDEWGAKRYENSAKWYK